MAEGFALFQQGMNDLRAGFERRNEVKAQKADAERVAGGIEGLRASFQEQGADPQTIDIATKALTLSKGTGAMDAVKYVTDNSFSKSALDHLTKLENRFLSERQSGTLTPERAAAYQKEAMAIAETDKLFKGAYHSNELARKVDEKKQLTDIEMQRDVFKANLEVKSAELRQQNWLKAIDDFKKGQFDLKKARVPEVLNKDIYQDGLPDAAVEMTIRRTNPDLSESEIASFVWLYQHRDEAKSTGVMAYIMDAMKMGRVFNMKYGDDAKKADKKEAKSPTAPPDFLNELTAAEDD